MKETIGEKIKRLRKKKGLTQSNIHHNQSQVALIEKGTKKGGISNPEENTLRVIAQNMEMTFDELITDTTWEKPESATIGKELAFSPSIFDIKIDDMLNITWSHKAYPLFDDNGERNEFCFYSGQALINKCSKCKRGITKVKQQFCSGCGNILFELLMIDSRILNKLTTPGLLKEYYACEEVIEILVRSQSHEKAILQDFEEMATTKDKSMKDKLFEHYTNPPKGTPFGLDHVGARWRKDLLTSIAKQLLSGKELELEDLTLLQFNDQVYDAVIKKLRMSLKNMERPDDVYDESAEIKLQLFKKVATQLNLRLTASLGDPEMTSKDMMEMLKDLSTTDDSNELIEKLQSKIDLNTESDENINDEKISEDGNSETAAENKTEQKNDNAKNKDNKESNND